MELVKPALEHLPSYIDALRRGWSPDTTRAERGAEELEEIARDAEAFLAGLEDLDAKGPPITLPDGSTRPRLPGFRRWMWDGEFCGSIGFRWQLGTTALPDHVLGHVGYAVVPWKRGRGYATRAVQLLLPEIAAFGLDHIQVTTDETNLASQRVLEKCGARFVERFTHPQFDHSLKRLRYRLEVPKPSGK
jgi:predicted acetyltransferase